MGPIVRIIARWLSSALVTYGFVHPNYAAGLDNDVAVAVGVAVGVATEAYYIIAKRMGWRT